MNFSSQVSLKQPVYLIVISFPSIQLIHVLIHLFLIHQIFILVCLQIVQKKKYSIIFKYVYLFPLLKMEFDYFTPCSVCGSCPSVLQQVKYLKFSSLLLKIDSESAYYITHNQ